MKKRHYVMIHACFLILITVFFTACNDEIDRGQDSGTKGVSVIPNPMEIGQTISITGPDFKNATAVVFPDNIPVSSFDKVGDLQINVVVPTGTKSGGNITVELPGGDFTIPIDINLLNPEVTGTYTASGATDIGPNEVLIIQGKDLINVSEIIFPGEAQATVRAMDFRRKGNEEIIVVVPVGTAKVVASMTLKTLYGIEITSTPVDFTGGGYIPPEILMLCGEGGSGKAWVFDKSNPLRWWYMTDTSPDAFWWQPDVGPADEGGHMVFSFIDGSQQFTYYSSPTAEPVEGTTWEVNSDWTELKLVGAANILGVEGGGVHVDGSKEFTILEFTEDRLVLFSTPVVWSPGWVWVFKPK